MASKRVQVFLLGLLWLVVNLGLAFLLKWLVHAR